VKLVDVVGDCRRYQYLVTLRASETTNFITTTVAALPDNPLNRVCALIINQAPGITGGIYDI
jgi:GMP synthase (glutamine-hydrolysing)